MKLKFPTNWRTTLAGLVSAIFAVVTQMASMPQYQKWAGTLSLLSLGIAVMFAADSKETIQTSDMDDLGPDETLTKSKLLDENKKE